MQPLVVNALVTRLRTTERDCATRRVWVWGTEGRGFKSRQPDAGRQIFISLATAEAQMQLGIWLDR